MATDFTVIQPVRQRFGDADFEYDALTELEAPFVGQAKDFPFPCPNVDTGQMGVLQLESLGLSAGLAGEPKRNLLQINGVDIPRGSHSGARFSGRNTRAYFTSGRLIHSLCQPTH
jgi:hypothetical protein